MREAVAKAVHELGSVDILVTAAGIDSWGNAWELTDDQWNAMLAVNLTGVWQSAKAASPHMISKRSGAMVFIGSVLSHRANRQFAHYTAAKHGVLGLVRSFALELAEYNVRVNSVDPTVVLTDMVTNQEYMDNLVGHPGATEEEVRNHYLEWNVLPTPWIEPRDVADAALFLASDEARFITGLGLPLDAGAMLRLRPIHLGHDGRLFRSRRCKGQAAHRTPRRCWYSDRSHTQRRPAEPHGLVRRATIKIVLQRNGCPGGECPAVSMTGCSGQRWVAPAL